MQHPEAMIDISNAPQLRVRHTTRPPCRRRKCSIAVALSLGVAVPILPLAAKTFTSFGGIGVLGFAPASRRTCLAMPTLLSNARSSDSHHHGRSSSSVAARRALPDASSLCLSIGQVASGVETFSRSVSVSEVVSASEDFVVSVVGWAVVLLSCAILRIAGAEHEDTPKKYLQRNQTTREQGDQLPIAFPSSAVQEGGSPVICVGDSLTRGNLSADWVSGLRENLADKFGGTPTVLNAGVNMECTQNILSRLDDVIACRPSHVSVLVGTNDLKAGLSPVEGLLYKLFGGIQEAPSVDSYERDLVEIRERLLATGASVALVSPPVLGEDLLSEANRRAAAFAKAVRRVAAGGGERCAYLPLFERTAEKLPENGGESYDGVKFFALLCTLCVDVHLRHRDLDELQRERDLGVTVDLVHLGPTAAQQLVEMVADFVEARRPRMPQTCLAN